MNIGICGLDCSTCSGHTSGECRGCRKGGCSNDCAMRLCAEAKGVHVCKFCDEYESCDKIQEFHERNPHGKENLDAHYHKRKDGVMFASLHTGDEHTYSSVAAVGNMVYTSHTGGMVDDAGNRLDTLGEQTHQTLKNLRVQLEEFGLDLDSVVKTTVYLRTMKDFRQMRDAYREYFTDGYPVRMTATTEFFDEGRLIMIDAVAYKRDDC